VGLELLGANTVVPTFATVTPAGVDRLFEEKSAGTPLGSMRDFAFLDGLHSKYRLKTMERL